jgi:hypothetical protein
MLSNTNSSPISVMLTLGADAAALTFEAQFVIFLRLLMIATGNRAIATEMNLMVAEKVEAFLEAATELMKSLVTGDWHLGSKAAVAVLKDRVHANAARLTSAAA